MEPPLTTQMSSDNRRLRGQTYPARSGVGTPKHVGNCSSALSSSIMCPAPPVSTRTASLLPCSFAATLPHAPTQAPLPDSGFSSTCVTAAGTGHHPGRQSPSPVRASLHPIGHVAGPGNGTYVSPASTIHIAVRKRLPPPMSFRPPAGGQFRGTNLEAPLTHQRRSFWRSLAPSPIGLTQKRFPAFRS